MVMKLTTKTPEVILPLFDQRMILVKDYVITNKINGITTNTEFLKSIGFVNVNNYSAIAKGKYSFTIYQLMTACKVYGVDANFLLVESCTNMFAVEKEVNPIRQLTDAVQRVKLALSSAEALVKELKG